MSENISTKTGNNSVLLTGSYIIHQVIKYDFNGGCEKLKVCVENCTETKKTKVKMFTNMTINTPDEMLRRPTIL